MSEEPEETEGDEEESSSEGWDLLTDTWFSTISELDEIMTNSEDPRARIEAARVLLEYFKSFGQSLNPPWIPDRPTVLDDDDDDIDEDDDE